MIQIFVKIYDPDEEWFESPDLWFENANRKSRFLRNHPWFET